MDKLKIINETIGNINNYEEGRDVIHSLIEKIKNEFLISVVHGGDRTVEGAVIHQTRNPRSDKSYASVAADIANSLTRLGFKRVDLIPEDMRIGDRMRQFGTGIAWINSGGTQGYASTAHAASMMEMFGVPYIGHNPFHAALLDNKHIFKHCLNSIGVKTPEFLVVDFNNSDYSEKLSEQFDTVFPGVEYFVVKPVSGRASLHVHRARGRQEARNLALQVHQATGNLVMIERFISGVEYTVAVNGPYVSVARKLENLSAPFTFSPTMRIMGTDEPIFTSMDLLPIGSDRCKLLDPNDAKQKEIILALYNIATRIHNGFGLEAMVRVDIRSDPDGQLYVLEANPKPDLQMPSGSKFSFVASGLSQYGMDYDDLILTAFAARIHFLITHRRVMIPQIVNLIR